MDFADHFSGHSADYRRFRPDYPQGLFAWLAEQAPGRGLAWDAGTGNGQAAIGLAAHFDAVIATDASAAQIANAATHVRVRYEVAAGNLPGVADRAVDLVSVAQALHWFDIDRFFTEVRRVLKPDGVLAVWAYNRNFIAPGIDGLVRAFQEETVGPFWPPERVYVDQGYRDVRFPFREIAAPSFVAQHDWTARQFLEYLRTWSSVKAYERELGVDPVDLFEPELLSAWGDADRERCVSFPLILRAGRVE